MPDGIIAKPARKSRLLAVAPDTIEPKRPKVLIYGPPGCGKTWSSLEWPRVFYVDTEGGADLDHYRAKLKNAGGMYLGQDQGSLDLPTVIGQVQALATEKHEFKTIVFDSITNLWNTRLADEQERLGDKDAFGAFKKLPTRQIAELLRWVNRLDLNCIFIAHQKDLWGLNEKGQREQIGATFDGPDKLDYQLHLVLNIYKTGPTRRARIGKSRLLAFPESDVFEWSYSNFAERWGRDVIEKEAAPLVLASAEQVAEVRRLLEVVRVADDWTEKCFKKANVDDWGDMDEAIIAKVIESLKSKLV